MFSGKDLVQAVEQKNWDTLIKLAMKNRKSKKFDRSLKAMIQDLNSNEIQLMWARLFTVATQTSASIVSSEEENKSINKRKCNKLNCLLQAIINLGISYIEMQLPIISNGFFNIIAQLSGKLLKISKTQESLGESAYIFIVKSLSLNHRYEKKACFKCFIYLMQKLKKSKFAKADVKQLHSIRFSIIKLLETEVNDAVYVIEWLKDLALESKFIRLTEGREILKLVLAADKDHIYRIFPSIKGHLKICTISQAASYGCILFETWIMGNDDIKTVLELKCVQAIINLAVGAQTQKLLKNCQRVLNEFFSHKRKTNVARLLFELYQPVQWRFVKSPDGRVRSNATDLFLDHFPILDPEKSMPERASELTEQMLLIKDLLTDDLEDIRIKVINGLCLTIKTQWWLIFRVANFPEAMLNTYFDVLIESCSQDSSSPKLRSAVVNGFKTILENENSIPLLAKNLPRFREVECLEPFVFQLKIMMASRRDSSGASTSH